MSNFDTIQAITDNIQSVLRGQGIDFIRRTFDDLSLVPASGIPLGEIYYRNETFEYTFGERPKYAAASYLVRVILREPDPVDMMRQQQKWAHIVRDALTVPALNTGALAASQLVSRVITDRVEADNTRSDGLSAMNYQVSVQYRES